MAKFLDELEESFFFAALFAIALTGCSEVVATTGSATSASGAAPAAQNNDGRVSVDTRFWINTRVDGQLLIYKHEVTGPGWTVVAQLKFVIN